MRMTHDNPAFIAKSRRGQVGERGAQAAIAPAIDGRVPLESPLAAFNRNPIGLLAKSGALHKFGPAERNEVDGGLSMDPHQAMARVRAENVLARTMGFPCPQHAQDFRHQGDDSAHLARLAAAIINDAGAEVYHFPSEITQIAVVHRPVEPQAHPETLHVVGRIPEGGNLVGRVPFDLADSLIADRAGAGLLEVRSISNAADMTSTLAPSEHGVDVGNGASHAAGGFTVEALCEAMEMLRREIRDRRIGSDRGAEYAERADVIEEGERAEWFGPTCFYPPFLSDLEQAGEDANRDAFRGDFFGIMVRTVNLRSPAYPVVFNLTQRNTLAAHEDHPAFVPSHPPVTVNGEWEFGGDMGWRPCNFHKELRCGIALWDSSCYGKRSMFTRLLENLYQGLKIHVSPVRFRLCPIHNSPKKRGISSVLRGFFVSRQIDLNVTKTPYMTLTVDAARCGSVVGITKGTAHV